MTLNRRTPKNQLFNGVILFVTSFHLLILLFAQNLGKSQAIVKNFNQIAGVTRSWTHHLPKCKNFYSVNMTTLVWTAEFIQRPAKVPLFRLIITTQLLSWHGCSFVNTAPIQNFTVLTTVNFSKFFLILDFSIIRWYITIFIGNYREIVSLKNNICITLGFCATS